MCPKSTKEAESGVGWLVLRLKSRGSHWLFTATHDRMSHAGQMDMAVALMLPTKNPEWDMVSLIAISTRAGTSSALVICKNGNMFMDTANRVVTTCRGGYWL